MAIDFTTIDRLAQLSSIDIAQQNHEQLCQQLNNILNLVNKLQEINTDPIEPLAHPMELTQLLREDTISECDVSEHLFDNAPLSQDSLFLVPQVIKVE